MKTKKYLYICNWGQVRSVAMSQYIHELNGKWKNPRHPDLKKQIKKIWKENYE